MTNTEQAIHYLEIVAPDAEALRNLYESAYGWHFQAADPTLGNAFVAELSNGSLLGIRAPLQPDEKPTVRTYVRVIDLEVAVKNATRMGADILLERMELPGHGVIAIYDHGGIEHGIWQVS